jgi:two-component system, chemotaxis family, protein-glutamate methylesterase/glutaminase
MPGHDVVVVGASAGGVEAVSTLVAGLPADLPAAVCIVVHLRPDAQSRLTQVLARATSLPVVPARDGAPLRSGTIHVAVPDLHLLVERGDDGHGVLRVIRGPRENRARPAVDPLFRSAALAFGPRVIGVVLSGALDDGTAGLWTVKDRGGIAVVQDPDDAAVSSMPTSALAEVAVDEVAPAHDLGPLLGRLAREPVAPTAMYAAEEPAGELQREVGITVLSDEYHQESERYGRPSRFSCPECGGVLWDVSGRGPFRFRCEVGHAHTAASLAESQTEAVEAAMWSALRALEDKAELARRRSSAATEHGLPLYAASFAVQEQAAEQHAAALRALLRLDGRSGIRPRMNQEGASEPADVIPEDDRFAAGRTTEADAATGADTRAGTTTGAD